MVRSLLLALLSVVALQAPISHASELLAGVATVDITPPVPWRMSGYFVERVSTGVKDPLHAKAVVFQQGETAAALVFCDLIGMPRHLSQRIRTDASQATGIPVDNIAISATHTHTGPLYFGVLRDHFHERAIKKSGGDTHEPIDYSNQLAERIVLAVTHAKSALKPVKLAAAVAREERLAFNRRYHMRNGTVQFNPGQLNPDIVRPAGPVDPDAGVISLSADGGDQPFAAIVEFALHLDTTGGTEYSADYPRYLEKRLRSTLGSDFTALFGIGTCGDINHIDVQKKGVRRAEEIGGMLAETVGAALQSPSMEVVDDLMLAVASAMVEVPLQQYTEAEIAQARQDIELIGQRKLAFLEEVKACSILETAKLGGPAVGLEVQVFRLSNDVAIVTLPAEIFVELGLAIKAASPFKTTLVVELTNDCLGYIPTKKAFAEGRYETVNSRVQPGAGEALVEAAIKLLKDIHSTR